MFNDATSARSIPNIHISVDVHKNTDAYPERALNAFSGGDVVDGSLLGALLFARRRADGFGVG
jgi:hypothetical protein